MASKSLTALPSVISVMAEKTVIAMKCHTRGFEKVIWPVIAIILTSLSLVCLAVAAGTSVWIELKVFNTTDDRGYIRFGLFSGSHIIRFSELPITKPSTGSYYVFDRFTFSINKIYATFGLSCVAMLLCIALIVFTFLNSYQTVTTWWKGPPMMYLISLFTGLCAIAAVSVFLDYYIWELDTTQIFIDSTTIQEQTFGNATSFRYLIEKEGYNIIPTLNYSFGLHTGGSVLLLLVVLLSWRLAVLLPLKADPGVSSAPVSGGLSTHNIGLETEMGELNVMYGSPNDPSHLASLQPPLPSYENEVLY